MVKYFVVFLMLGGIYKYINIINCNYRHTQLLAQIPPEVVFVVGRGSFTDNNFSKSPALYNVYIYTQSYTKFLATQVNDVWTYLPGQLVFVYLYKQAQTCFLLVSLSCAFCSYCSQSVCQPARLISSSVWHDKSCQWLKKFVLGSSLLTDLYHALRLLDQRPSWKTLSQHDIKMDLCAFLKHKIIPVLS